MTICRPSSMLRLFPDRFRRALPARVASRSSRYALAASSPPITPCSGNTTTASIRATTSESAALTLPEAGTTPDHWEREFVVNHKLSLTPRLVNQFQALVGREHPELSSRRQQLLAPTGFRLCARGQEDRAPRRRRRVLRPHRGRTVGGLGFLCNKSRSNCPSCACRLGTFRPP
jgi:hypothetical protein